MRCTERPDGFRYPSASDESTVSCNWEKILGETDFIFCSYFTSKEESRRLDRCVSGGESHVGALKKRGE